MPRITLTLEQAEVYRQALEAVQVCDPTGNPVGTLDPELNPEFIAELKRRAQPSGPWYTGEQIQRHFRILEEAWAKEGPFDEKRMMEILEHAQSVDHP